jgi:hypothetical protein
MGFFAQIETRHGLEFKITLHYMILTKIEPASFLHAKV